MADGLSPSDYHLTLDEENEEIVLELVWNNGPVMLIRDNGSWIPVDPDADNPRIWDRIIVWVTPEAVDVFDQAEQVGEIERGMFEDYEIPDEDVA